MDSGSYGSFKYTYTIVSYEILWVPLVIQDLKKIAIESFIGCVFFLNGFASLMHSSFLLLSTTTLPYSNHLMEQLDGWTSHACWFLLSCQAVTKKPFGDSTMYLGSPNGAPCFDWSLGFFWRLVSPKNIETYLPHPKPNCRVIPSGEKPTQSSSTTSEAKVATINFKASMRIHVCPKTGISPTIPFWGWDFRPSYSRDGPGFLGTDK